MKRALLVLAILVPFPACGLFIGDLPGPADGGTHPTDGGEPAVEASGVDASSDGSGIVPDASVVDDSAPPDGSDGGDEVSLPTVTVSGRAVDAQTPSLMLAGRKISLFDTAGHLTTVTTAFDGTFHAPGVTPPYDIAVFPSPLSNNPWGTPIVYFSVNTPHPQVTGTPDLGSSPPSGASATVTVPITLPDCAVGTTCSYGFWLSDNTAVVGGSGAGMTYTSLSAPTSLVGSASWPLPSTSDTLRVDVIAFDATSTYYYYGTLDGVQVTNTKSTTTPPVALNQLNGSTFTGTASTIGVPASWAPPSFELQVFLPLPSGQTGTAGPNLPLRTGTGSLTAVIPGPLPGAEFVMTATVSDPAYQTTAFAASSGIGGPASNSVTIKGPPAFQSPAVRGGSVSRSNGAFTWTATSTTQLNKVIFSSDTEAGFTQDLVVYTFGTSIPVARLAALGAGLNPDSIVLNIIAYGRLPSLDAVLDESSLAVADRTEGSFANETFVLAP